jgi:type II secretory pathway component GspD/PulD (secretin)
VFRANTVSWLTLVVSLHMAAAYSVAPLAAQAPAPVGPGAPMPPFPVLDNPTPPGNGIPLPLLGAPAVSTALPQSTGANQGGASRFPDQDRPNQPTGRPSQAHIALNRAIDCQRRGDYELAAPLFQDAFLRKSDLTPTEQGELSRLMQDNTTALQARREGTINLRIAEKAVIENRHEEAQEWLRKVALNEQFLTPVDRQRFQSLYKPTRRLSEAPRPEAAPTSPSTPIPPANDPAQMAGAARDQVKQARVKLGELQLEAAEQLAQSADRMKVAYNAGEDTPANVLRDVAKARNDPKILLGSARAALQRQQYDEAERYANLSNQIGSSWSFNLFGDSPSKVLKDIQAARAKAAAAPPASPFSKPPTEQAQNPTPPPKDSGGVFGLRNIFGGKPKTEQQASASTPGAGDGPGTAARGPDMQGQANPMYPTAPSVPGNPGPNQTMSLAQLTIQTSGSSPAPTVTPSSPASPVAAAPQPPTALAPTTTPALSRPPDALKEPQADETVKARGLVVQARKALQEGKYAEARKYNEQARMLHSNLFYWEDNPSKVAADIARLEGQVTQVRADNNPATSLNSGKDPKEQTVALLQVGRTQLAENKIDDALATLLKIQSLGVTNWGLFDRDTPERLRQDIDKARIKRDQAESVVVLAEARRLFEKGDYVNAKAAAYRAQALHGLYPRWDFSPRPSQLLAEIEAAEKKQYKAFGGTNPAQPGNDVKKDPMAQGQNEKTLPTSQGRPEDVVRNNAPGAGASRNLGTGLPAGEQVRMARQFLADARAALQKGDKDAARMLAEHVNKMNVILNIPGEETPETIFRDLDRLARGQPIGGSPASGVPSTMKTGPSPDKSVNASPLPPKTPLVPPTTTVQNPPVNPLPVPPPANVANGPTYSAAFARNPGGVGDGLGKPPLPEPNSGLKGMTMPTDPSAQGRPQSLLSGVSSQKAQAQMLVAEARQLQRESRLVEARRKGIEAQRLGAPFGPEEDSPELLLQQLASLARQRTDFLIRNATEVASYGKGTVGERLARAEQCLVEARQMALAFGQDAQPVDACTQWLVGLKTGGDPGYARATGPMNPQGAQASIGQTLLDDARRELKAGDTVKARKMAIDAAQEKYGVSEQAFALLRSIDIEENNRRTLDVHRAFDAAQQAYNRRDYAYAASVLAMVDPKLLDADRRERLKNIMMTPEMSSVRTASATAQSPGGVQYALNSNREGPERNNGSAQPGNLRPLSGDANAHASDQAKPGLLEATQAMREVNFQRLRKQGQEAQIDAAEKFRVGQTDEALEVLNNYLNTLDLAQLDAAKTTLLKRSVEQRMQQFQLMKTQRDFLAGQAKGKDQNTMMRDKIFHLEEAKQKKIADLMKQFNALYKDGKYVEARTCALKAKELDPDNGVVAAAYLIARNQIAITDNDKIKEGRAATWLKMAQDADKMPDAEVVDKEIILDKDPKHRDRQNKRHPLALSTLHKSEKEREIERRLSMPVNLNFTDTPLRQVLDDMRTFYGINIWTDEQAAVAEGIDINRPVTVKLEQICLRSALTLLLKGSRLTYHVKDDVLQITTEKEASGKFITTTYLVTDLVIPVQDFGPPNTSQLTPQTPGVTPMSSQPSPLEYTTGLMGGTPVGQGASPYGDMRSPGYGTSPPSNGPGTVTRQGPKQTQERLLIDLITRVISPHSWSDQGGQGSIDYHPLTMALVVNQSPDIQEQISDLLAALRRLQDQEVAVEVKVVSISDDFYEVIGVNFNINLPTNKTGLSTAIAGGYQPSRLIAGITPAGNLTNDLSIPITNNSFNNAFQPFFSGPQAAFPGLGGVQMGLAFLSDIQVFLFMEAAQSDRRTNVMQAPKITLFNGQTATVQVQEQSPYVANVNVINANGQVIFQPQINPLNTGVQLQIQAVISADRRFVRMSLQPTFTNIAVPGPPNLFPIVVPVFPTTLLPGQGPNPIIFTQYIQQQATQSITVGTTVAVPDGGTVVMGGLKTVSESRSEYGPPILSKIPYLDRLFKNVAYGRESSSLLIMVTPRIIILEEEQEYETGFVEAQGDAANR